MNFGIDSDFPLSLAYLCSVNTAGCLALLLALLLHKLTHKHKSLGLRTSLGPAAGRPGARSRGLSPLPWALCQTSSLQVAAPRRRRRRRRTRPGRPRSRSCCAEPASVRGSTCAWDSASCPRRGRTRAPGGCLCAPE